MLAPLASNTSRPTAADAIVAMRYNSASVMEGTQEMLAYGTAVKFV